MFPSTPPPPPLTQSVIWVSKTRVPCAVEITVTISSYTQTCCLCVGVACFWGMEINFHYIRGGIRTDLVWQNSTMKLMIRYTCVSVVYELLDCFSLYVQLVSMCFNSIYIWYLIQEICIISQLLRLQYIHLKTEFYIIAFWLLFNLR